MKWANLLLVGLCAALTGAGGDSQQKTYRWVDDDGVVHFGDSVPAEFADKEKQILNDQGISVGRIRGKKTEEEILEEERQATIAAAREKQRRADQALLSTYLSVAEIEMHRDRRIELLFAQTKITDLYLGNLTQRLAELEEDAQAYRPYSEDPEAPPVPPEMSDNMAEMRARIKRYEELRNSTNQQAQLIAKGFQADIDRFRALKERT